jgi:hypothetical protein
MLYLLAGFLVFWLGLYALKAFSQANPAALARLIRRASGWAALLAAALLLARGRIDMAIGLGGFALWLLKISYGSPLGLFKSAGGREFAKASCVRSAMIEMELDHATGRMRGTILAGPDEGKLLNALTRPQCEALHRLCCRDDPEGARLLEAYLDRRFAGWRSTDDQRRDAGTAEAGRRPGAMSKDEAYEVLGLQKGASREEVVRSHRSLMKKLHPDHGGTTDLAARVNEAKDVLMRRHQ